MLYLSLQYVCSIFSPAASSVQLIFSHHHCRAHQHLREHLWAQLKRVLYPALGTNCSWKSPQPRLSHGSGRTSLRTWAIQEPIFLSFWKLFPWCQEICIFHMPPELLFIPLKGNISHMHSLIHHGCRPAMQNLSLIVTGNITSIRSPPWAWGVYCICYSHIWQPRV